ncbi:hypothetical protein RFI_35692, partial [Reticulomyxa filosa]
VNLHFIEIMENKGMISSEQIMNNYLRWLVEPLLYRIREDRHSLQWLGLHDLKNCIQKYPTLFYSRSKDLLKQLSVCVDGYYTFALSGTVNVRDENDDEKMEEKKEMEIKEEIEGNEDDVVPWYVLKERLNVLKCLCTHLNVEYVLHQFQSSIHYCRIHSFHDHFAFIFCVQSIVDLAIQFEGALKTGLQILFDIAVDDSMVDMSDGDDIDDDCDSNDKDVLVNESLIGINRLARIYYTMDSVDTEVKCQMKQTCVQLCQFFYLSSYTISSPKHSSFVLLSQPVLSIPGKEAIIYLIGEFGHLLPNFEKFLEIFQSTFLFEPYQLQLAILIAGCKIYLQHPQYNTRQLLRSVLLLGLSKDDLFAPVNHLVKQKTVECWELLGMRHDVEDIDHSKTENIDLIRQCIADAKNVILKPMPISAELHSTLQYGYSNDCDGAISSNDIEKAYDKNDNSGIDHHQDESTDNCMVETEEKKEELQDDLLTS